VFFRNIVMFFIYSVLCVSSALANEAYMVTVSKKATKTIDLALDATSVFVGQHKSTLILAGGYDAGPVDAKTKEFRDSIWTTPQTEDGSDLIWQRQDKILPVKMAYGASVNSEAGVFLVGGVNEDGASKNALLLRWNDELKTVSVHPLPDLPIAAKDLAITVLEQKLYVMVKPLSFKQIPLFYSLDIAKLEQNFVGETAGSSTGHSAGVMWKQESFIPMFLGDNEQISNLSLAVQNDGWGESLFVIAGKVSSDGKYASDVWKYNPNNVDQKDPWTERKSVSINDVNYRVVAKSISQLGPSHILALGVPIGQELVRYIAYNTITNSWTNYSDYSEETSVNGSNMAGGSFGQNFMWLNKLHELSNGSTNGHHQLQLSTVQVKAADRDFGEVNLAVLLAYLIAMVLVGVWFASRNLTTDDYFRGGQNIPWWAAACSIYATMLSSLTYVALPALVYRTDWLVYIGIVTIIFVTPIAVYVAMPFFRSIDATSAYEYLSKRFNLQVRQFASALFSLFHLGRIGIVLALTALALAAVTQIDPMYCVLIMGGLCLIYCTLGGVEAVVWTDTIQTVVLVIGAILCLVYIVDGVDGGISGLIEAGSADGKFRMVDWDFGENSYTKLSLWVIVLGGLGQNFSSYTSDQAIVQRYMVTKDAKAARKSIWANGIIASIAALLFFGIGTGLYGYYQSNPERIDPTMKVDQIFPAFIANELPMGIAGLIVAGIFAAAQSTVSTSMNSISTTLVTDFLKRCSRIAFNGN